MVKLRPSAGLTKKASLNAVASALDYCARVLVNFIITPLLVMGLGDFAYGVWQVLGRLVGYISPASGRPTQALKWTIAKDQISDDYHVKRQQVGNAVLVALLFLPLVLILGAVLAWFAPIWLRAPSDLTWIVRVAAGMLVLNLIMVSFVEIPRSVLEGENLGYKRMGLSAGLVFLGGGLTVLALYLNTGLIGITAATAITTLITGILFFWITKTYVPWFGFAKPSFADVRRFLGLSAWFLAWKFVMNLMRASDVVILGILGSAQLVTTYTLTKFVPETIINFVAILVLSAAPGLGGVIGAGNLQKACRVRNEIMLLTWLLFTVVGSAALLWNQSFLDLWVGEQYHAGPIPLLLIILMVGQFTLIRTDANVIDLNLDLRRKVQLGLLSTILSILAAGALVGYFGFQIIGICLGFLVGRLVLTFAYPWLVAELLDVSFGAQLGSVVRPALVTILLFATVTWLSKLFVATTWASLVFGVAASLAIISVLTVILGTSTEQRVGLVDRVRQLTRGTKEN